MSNQPCETPFEEQRAQALAHYEEAASAIHHYSFFVHTAIKAYQRDTDYSKVNRVEVIDGCGRSYVNWGVNKIEVSIQDQGTTMKIFIK